MDPQFVGPPPVGASGSGVVLAGQQAGAWTSGTSASQTGFWDIECHLAGGEETRASVGDGLLLTRYSKAHLQMLQGFWSGAW